MCGDFLWCAQLFSSPLALWLGKNSFLWHLIPTQFTISHFSARGLMQNPFHTSLSLHKSINSSILTQYSLNIFSTHLQSSSAPSFSISYKYALQHLLRAHPSHKPYYLTYPSLISFTHSLLYVPTSGSYPHSALSLLMSISTFCILQVCPYFNPIYRSRMHYFF